MFSADLSWTDDTVEKVGERRERKERGRGNSISSSNSSSNGRRPSSRKPSSSDKTTLTSITDSFRRSSLSKERNGKKPNLAPIDPGRYPVDPRQQYQKVLPTIPSPTQPSCTPLENELPPWGNYPEADDPTFYEDKVAIVTTKPSLSSEGTSSRSDFGHSWAISANNDSNTFWSSYQQTAEKVIMLNSCRPDTFISTTSSTKVCNSEFSTGPSS